jgi:hypothetical protein
MEKKLEDLNQKVSNQENRRRYKSIVIIAMVIASFLFLLILIGIISFYSV